MSEKCEHVLTVSVGDRSEYAHAEASCSKCGRPFLVQPLLAPGEVWDEGSLQHHFSVYIDRVRSDHRETPPEVVELQKVWGLGSYRSVTPSSLHYLIQARRYEAEGLRFVWKFCAWPTGDRRDVPCGKPALYLVSPATVAVPADDRTPVCGIHLRAARRLGFTDKLLEWGEQRMTAKQLAEAKAKGGA